MSATDTKRTPDAWLLTKGTMRKLVKTEKCARSWTGWKVTPLYAGEASTLGGAAGDPRGYVFVDRDGDAWGWDETGRAPGSTARRPFRTEAQARRAGNKCSYGCREVRIWRTTDRVPLMPETAWMIACAPELLASLREMTGHVIEMCETYGLPPPDASLERANDAIAKGARRTPHGGIHEPTTARRGFGLSSRCSASRGDAGAGA